MATVSLSGVTKVFDEKNDEIVAVDDLDLDIADGEFLVLVGPSGCGKSTTLRMVAGLETPTEGTISIDGEPITHLSPQERDIAMVFQSYALYPHMSVRGNMSFGLQEATDLSGEEITDRVDDTAALLDISELLDRKPGELSGGQQQRVALGRAIVREPAAFLLDEPLANLDAKLRSNMRTELQHLQEDLGTTTIYVTHDQTEAMTMSDRIAILNDGRLQQVGTPLECYHEPSNQFVAGFIGEPSMNFISMTLDGSTLVGEHLEYDLSQETINSIENPAAGIEDREVGRSVADGDEIVLGIRPEDVELVEGGTGDHTFPARIDVIEPQGDENTVHLAFEGQEFGEASLTSSIGGMRQYDEGNTVTVEIPENAIHLFDARTGVALHNRGLGDIEDEHSSLGTGVA